MRMTVSDEGLAMAAAGGDRAAFAALLERHYDRLFAFAFRAIGNRAEAEDLTQDICLALDVIFGTSGGGLFLSHDRGESWERQADFLPPIYYVALI